MRQRSNAITWEIFYELMKESFCEHIDKENGKYMQRNWVKFYFICNSCYKKYKILCRPCNIRNQEIGKLK